MSYASSDLKVRASSVKALFEELFTLAESSSHSDQIANKKTSIFLPHKKKKIQKGNTKKADLSLDESLELEPSSPAPKKRGKSDNSRSNYPLSKPRQIKNQGVWKSWKARIL